MSHVNSPMVLAPLLWMAVCGTTLAQGHNDITFRYSESQIVAEGGAMPGVFAAQFDTTGIFQQYASNPGFASEIDAGGGLQAGDVVVYHVLEGLSYWNGEAFADPPAGMLIRIENNLPTVPDTLVSGTSGVQLGSSTSPMRNVIGAADGAGEVHAHVDFFLEPNPFPDTLSPSTHGAYGLKLSLASSRAGIDPSEPFWVVFNFGLGETGFTEALAAFAELLEPSLAGDYNADGVVDAADYLVWRNSVGSTTNLAANGDDTGPSQGVIDGADYVVWKSNWARGQPGGARLVSSTRPVPESGGLAMAMAMLLLWLRRSLRQRGSGASACR